MKSPLDLANVDIEITDIPLAHFITSKRKLYSMKNRELYCFILIVKGSLTLICNGKRAIANKGDIMLINKGEDYNVIYSENIDEDITDFYIVEFDIADKNLSFLNRVNKVAHPETYVEIFKQLNRYSNFFHIPQGGYRMKSKALLYELIYNMFKEIYVSNLSPTETELEKTKNYIDANIKEKITVKMLADIAGYSVSYYKRKFKEFYRISPGEYIMDVRINKAKAMLSSKMYSIAEITNECGFSSESYFSHAFKNAVGVSPKQY